MAVLGIMAGPPCEQRHSMADFWEMIGKQKSSCLNLVTQHNRAGSKFKRPRDLHLKRPNLQLPHSNSQKERETDGWMDSESF